MLPADLRIDPESTEPVYRQIADAVMAAARDGRLGTGRRLPATRDLARHLGVNRQTVVAAYDHLAAEGWVSSHTGRGTFLEERRVEPAAQWLPNFSRAVEGPEVADLLSVYKTANTAGGISFAGSYPARDLLPVEEFGKAIDTALRRHVAEILVYGATAGFGPLRERIAGSMCERGSTATEPEDILVTNGAQQGLELVFHAFLERGDAVVIEEPTYTGALSVLGSIGARVVSVPVDDQGMRPDLLAIALERHRPRLMYVQPTFHNPTTSVMGEDRRRELLRLAALNRCLVVEDDWADGLRLDGDELPTLHAMDDGGRVIYISTFSKRLLPGLRVGWVSAPPTVMKRLIMLKQIRDCGTSPLLQAALHSFLETGGLEDHLRRVLPINRERRDRMLEALGRHLPSEASWKKPDGGLFVWVTLPEGFDGREMFLAVRREGVLFSSGELFHASTEARNTLRMTYSTATPDEIDRGVAIIGRWVAERQSGGSPSGVQSPTEAMPIL